MSLKWIRTSLGVNVIVNGNNRVIPSDHKYFDKILAGLKTGDDSIVKLMDEFKRQVENFDGVDFQIVGGELLFRGGAYHNQVLADKILDMVEHGMEAAPLIRFLEKVEQNPNPLSVERLWDWLKNVGLALADDGDIIGFKYVTKVDEMSEDDERTIRLKSMGAVYTDSYTKRFNYTPGKIAEMPRHAVVLDPKNSCAAGLHVGTYNYVSGNKHILIVKVNPADVVSVPEVEAQKMRCCRFQVLSELNQSDINDQGFNKPVYKVDGIKLSPTEFQKRNLEGLKNSTPMDQGGFEGYCDSPSADHWN